MSTQKQGGLDTQGGARVAVAAALACLYGGVSLHFGALGPGFPLWFFVPCGVIAGAGLLAEAMSRILPVPWRTARAYGEAPRLVRLSWRAAFRLPAWVALPFLPWNMLRIVQLHWPLRWATFALSAIVMTAVAVAARRCVRETLLLRYGAIATARVRSVDSSDSDDRATYVFDGGPRVITGSLWSAGYRVLPGEELPVFYDPDRPERHVVVCASWFDAR